MSDWLNEDEEQVKSTQGQLPNNTAPRMVREDTIPNIKRQKRSKKQVLLVLDEAVHEQLSRLVNLEKLAGNRNAAITRMFMEGLGLYLKKHKLPSIKALEEGAIITEEHVGK